MTKVLLIDDDLTRVRMINAQFKDMDICLKTVHTKNDALKFMEDEQFHLVIIDIMLPTEMSSIDPSTNAGIELIETIEKMKRIKKPFNIIGLTSDEEVFKNVQFHFNKRLIPLIHWQTMNDDWKTQLKNKLSYLIKIDNQNSSDITVDTAILTAVEDEFDSVYALSNTWEAISICDDPTVYYITDIPDKDGERKVVLVKLPEMGMSSASCITTKIINRFSPKSIYMVGICGGVKGKVNLCDIIVASRSWDYGSGKIKPKKDDTNSGYYEFEASPNQIQVDIATTGKLEAMTKDIITEITNDWNKEHKGNTIEPNLHIAPMPSGSSVITDAALFTEIVKPQHRKCVALDMETYGVYFAVKNSSSQDIKFLSIKCVSDYADDEKDDRYHEACCFTSAQFLFKSIQNGLL